MRFNPDRCIECGSPARPENTTAILWFCSKECHTKALLDFVPSNFQGTIEDDPAYKSLVKHLPRHLSEESPLRQHLRDFVKRWDAERTAALKTAFTSLDNRIAAETEAILRTRLEQESKQHQKELATLTQQADDAEAEAAQAEQTLANAIAAYDIKRHPRSNHTHILGGSGHGKTQLIQYQILQDIQTTASVILIDPKGLVVDRIRYLKQFVNSDRLIVIDPTDVHHPPALNLFHPASKRFRMYDESVKRMVLNKTIELYTYMFNTRNNKLTPKQETLFSFCIPVMLEKAENGATVLDLLRLLNDQLGDKQASLHNSPYQAYIGRLSPIHRDFFEHEYYTEQYGNTRREIRQRLQGILSKPEFIAMFEAPERKVDFFECMQTGKIVLVNTAKGMLGDDSSQLFGRYMIALITSALLERTAYPPQTWRDCHLYIDEAQDFLDDKSETLLDQAREYKLGLCIAHQRLGQLTESLHSAIMTNTAIKYAGGVSVDAPQMAKVMGTTPEFLQSQSFKGTHSEFACYVRGHTKSAATVQIPIGLLESLPHMNERECEAARERNRALVSAPRPEPQPLTHRDSPATPQRPPSDNVAQHPRAKPKPDPDVPPDVSTTW